MSETVSFHGILTPVDLGSLTVEEKANKLIPESKKEEVDKYYDSALEYIQDEMDYYFDSESEVLYKMEKQEFEEGSYIKLTKNDDGSIAFYTQFYNGGTCLAEMLDEGFEELA